MDKNKSELADFLHDTLLSPTASTLMEAIKNDHLLPWSVIDQINFNRFVADSIETKKGHLNQERKNLISTKTTGTQKQDNDDLCKFTLFEKTKQNMVFLTIQPSTTKTLPMET